MSPARVRPSTASTARFTSSKISDKFCARSSLRVKTIDASSASVVLKALLAESTPSQTRMDSELHHTGSGQYHACDRVRKNDLMRDRRRTCEDRRHRKESIP